MLIDLSSPEREQPHREGYREEPRTCGITLGHHFEGRLSR